MKNRTVFLNKIWKDNNHKIKLRNDSHQYFFHQLRPLSSEYFTPIESCFLFEIGDLKSLNKSDIWIVRDGAVPLLWFFYHYPHPSSLKSKLYVEASLEKFVPKAWLKNIGTYQLFSDQTKKPTQIILTGIASEDFLPARQLPHFYHFLESSVKKINLKSIRKCALISYRPLHYNYESKYFLNYFGKLYDFFGSQIESMNLSQASAIEDYSNALVIDINGAHLLSDNSLVHFFLGKGASLCQACVQKNKGKKVYVSDHHGFYLNDQIRSNNSLFDFRFKDIQMLDAYIKSHQRIGKNISRAEKKQMPWPHIFDKWIQTISL